MTKYAHIVFIDRDDESEEPLRIFDEQGVEAAVEYLSQWDNGDHGNNTYGIYAEPQAGSNDSTYKVGNYLLTVNQGLGYIGLEIKVKE